MPLRSKWQSLPTEAINPDTLALDKLTPAELVDEMLQEDRKMLAAVQREKDRIAVGIEILTQALRRGGRIVFVGAGTSGRLGVLESSEMPPTFGTKPGLVQAIMAGGKDAMLTPREGVDDNYEEGARSVNRLRPTKKDVVIGVSASGMTQFVRGGLTRARRAGSKIIFVTCDPRTELQTFVDLTIAPGVGPAWTAPERERELDVLDRGEGREQLEELEDHANGAAAPGGEPVARQLREAGAGHGDRAGGRPVDPGDQVEEGGFAAAGLADHGDELARAHVEIDPAERCERACRRLERLGYAAKSDHHGRQPSRGRLNAA